MNYLNYRDDLYNYIHNHCTSKYTLAFKTGKDPIAIRSCISSFFGVPDIFKCN